MFIKQENTLVFGLNMLNNFYLYDKALPAYMSRNNHIQT